MTNSFSNNIIFLDTEFTDLDPYMGEIISIGLVKLNGDSLYLELEYEGQLSSWASQHLSKLNETKVSRQKAKEMIKDFVGTSKPFPVCYIPQFDMVYLYKLFSPEEFPFDYHAVDMSSILFTNGINPRNFIDNSNLLKEYEVDPENYRKHHALDDAKLLRDFYIKFMK